MRLTIIREDGFVAIDGRGIAVDLSDMPEDLHAVQWYGDHGHVERFGWMNQTINSLASFQVWIDRWASAAHAIDNPPAPPVQMVPEEVSFFQGSAALMQAGYLDEVEAYMAAPDTDPFEKLAWKTITVIRRDSAMMAKVGQMFGLTDGQIDDLFRFAATIQA